MLEQLPAGSYGVGNLHFHAYVQNRYCKCHTFVTSWTIRLVAMTLWMPPIQLCDLYMACTRQQIDMAQSSAYREDVTLNAVVLQSMG